MCKKFIVLVLVLGLTSITSAALLSSYDFVEAAGTPATTADNPSASRGVAGTLMGGAALVADDGSLATASSGAAGGQVLSLDGVDDYVEIGGAGNNGWEDTCVWPCSTGGGMSRTLGMWINSNDFGPSGWHEVVAEGGNWSLDIGYNNILLGFWHVGSIQQDISSLNLDGGWHHIAGTLVMSSDGVAMDGSISLYVDGEKIAGVAHDKTYQGSWTGPRIGVGSAAWTSDRFVTGLVDEVFFTDTALSEAELHAIAGIPEPVTIALLGLGGLALIRKRRS